MRSLLMSIGRTLHKGRMYTILNVVGLTIGLAGFWIISAWVGSELSYDQFHENHKRIVRLVGNVKTDAETFDQAVTSLPMAAALKNDYPEVEETVRLDMNDCIVQRGETKFEEDGVVFTDPSFFSVFSFSLLSGDPRTALSEPYSVVLTSSIAEKYFGTMDPIGKNLTMFLYDPDGRGAIYRVTGVIADPPGNSHFSYRILGSMSTLEQARPDLLASEWRYFNNGFYTYLLLRRAEDRSTLEQKLPEFNERYLGERSRRMNIFLTFSLQPVDRIHLDSHLRYEIQPPGSREGVYTFATIGLAILLVACINYMNTSTARALGRAKEIGVKKVLGAGRGEIVRQVLTESLATSLISLVGAFMLIEATRPFVEAIAGPSLRTLYAPWTLTVIVGTTVLSGLLSGLYPALFLSGFSPIVIVRSWKTSLAGMYTRRGLVIIQFTVTIILLSCAGVVSSQLEYIRSKNLGFEKEALLVFDQNGFGEVNEGYEAFRNALLAHPVISGVTHSRGLIVGGLSNSHIETVDGEGNPLTTSIYRHSVGPDYLAVYGMTLVAGRDLVPADTGRAYIVNETAVQRFGWSDPQEAIGKPFRAGGTREGVVVGVVGDFNFASLRQRIDPIALSHSWPNAFSRITVRLDGSRLQEARQLAEEAWRTHFPEALLKDSFLDDRLERQYTSEMMQEKVLGWFVSLSILVACMGLFSLASYAIGQRVKEVGVRKVLGATVWGLIGTLSKEFMLLVAGAFVVATAFAWQIMSVWLENFSYRADLSVLPFLVAGLAAGTLAFMTVGVEAYRAARRNPVESLRYE